MAEVRVPDGASEEEAAAIVAAVNAHLAGRDADGSDEETRSWGGRRWRFRGRIEGLHGTPARVPRGAPDSPWRAAARSDRF